MTVLSRIKAARADRNRIFLDNFPKLTEIADGWTQELDPFLAMRREMENAFRAFNQIPSSANIGAGAPAISGGNI